MQFRQPKNKQSSGKNVVVSQPQNVSYGASKFLASDSSENLPSSQPDQTSEGEFGPAYQQLLLSATAQLLLTATVQPQLSRAKLTLSLIKGDRLCEIESEHRSSMMMTCPKRVRSMSHSFCQ